MTNIIPPSEQGIARIEHLEFSESDVMLFSSIYGVECTAGEYVQLFVGHDLMMSDTQMERKSNLLFVDRAHGNVLVGGLGIGMILHPVLADDFVQSVTVIEKYQDVIDLIGPTLQSTKLKIICADIFEWKPAKNQKFNTIYFDLWPTICTDNLIEIGKLHQKFKCQLDRTDPNCWMSSWKQSELQAMKRKERKGATWDMYCEE